MLRIFSVRGVVARVHTMGPQRTVHSMNPSVKTSVLLRRLPTKITSTTMPCLLLQHILSNTSAESIQQAFATCGAKSVSLIGGTTFQMAVPNSSDALKAADLINNVAIGGVKLMTSISKGIGDQYSLTIFNAPASATTEQVSVALKKALATGSFDTSKLAVTVAAPKTLALRLNADDKTKIDQFIASVRQMPDAMNGNITITEQKSITKPALFLRNVKHLESADLENLLKNYPVQRIEMIKKSKDGLLEMAVVYFSNTEQAFQCFSTLKNVSMNGKKLAVTYRDLFEPAVVLHNLPPKVKESDIKLLFAAFDEPKIEIKDGPDGKYAVVIVKSPVEAELARSALHKKVMGGKQISVGAWNIGDIGVEIGIKSKSTQQEETLLAALEKHNLTPKSVTYQSNISAYISFLTSNEASNAHQQFTDGTIESLRPMIPSSDSSSKLQIGGSLVSSSVTSSPSFSLSLSKVDGATSTQDLMSPLSTAFAGFALNILGADRSALIKFRRHRDVVPGIKAIKKMRLPHTEVEESTAENMWANLRVQRYRPLGSVEQSVDYLPAAMSSSSVEDNDDEDNVSGVVKRFRSRSPGFDEEFDQFSLRTVLKDYMAADPATRYELARNAFERAVSDARSTKDTTYLLGEHPSVSLRNEVVALINSNSNGGAASNSRGKKSAAAAAGLEHPLSHEATQRLFEIFLQREDMAKFSNDFKELSAFFGAADESDALNWSQFKADSTDDMQRMLKAMKEKEEEEMESLLRSVHKQKKRFAEDGSAASITDAGIDRADNQSFVNKGLTITVDGERKGEDQAVISLAGAAGDSEGYDDPNMLKDKDGNFWSGVILNSDIVQRVTPGDRVISQRVLVVVGNMRGAAGYGMGKGKTAADALKSAFRAALRNLTHIDLYDNFGLAHDLHGKHNSCHAYIKATPRSREMVASPFATEILTRFGIGSASIKLVGRRDPYAMVRAIFGALEQHENIDEYAKDRGKRYLTLKWAHDQKL